jgi:hypothetical protein
VWSAPLALAVTALALRMIGMTIVDDHALDAFGRGRYGPSATWFGRLQTANALERWVAPFNRGDSLYEQKKFAQAAAQFRTALGLAPTGRTCMVRVNLVLTVEAIGDSQAAAKSAQAARTYQTALSAADAGTCPLGAPQRTGERMAQVYAEIVTKLKALGAQPQPQPAQGQTNPTQPQPPADPKQTELQQRNDKAQRSDQQHQDQQNQTTARSTEGW